MFSSEIDKNLMSALGNARPKSNARAHLKQGGGPRVVVSTAAFHARVRGSVPGLGGLKETKCFFPIHVWKLVLWGASVTER